MSAEQAGPDLGPLVTVELRRVPVRLYKRSREHSDDLQREFALIYHGQDTAAGSVPSRLLQLVNDLRDRFAGFTEASYATLDEASERGEEEADVEFIVPAAVGPAAEALGRMLDEADDFCRSGDLLTLATPPDLAAFRCWFLEEFTRQVAGEAPRPWPDVAPSAG